MVEERGVAYHVVKEQSQGVDICGGAELCIALKDLGSRKAFADRAHAKRCFFGVQAFHRKQERIFVIFDPNVACVELKENVVSFVDGSQRVADGFDDVADLIEWPTVFEVFEFFFEAVARGFAKAEKDAIFFFLSDARPQNTSFRDIRHTLVAAAVAGNGDLFDQEVCVFFAIRPMPSGSPNDAIR